jgi:hypothetical protein
MDERIERIERDERPEANPRPVSHRQNPPQGWWSLDPGDTHVKGEESLCVGEAA